MGSEIEKWEGGVGERGGGNGPTIQDKAVYITQIVQAFTTECSHRTFPQANSVCPTTCQNFHPHQNSSNRKHYMGLFHSKCRSGETLLQTSTCVSMQVCEYAGTLASCNGCGERYARHCIQMLLCPKLYAMESASEWYCFNIK